jgi:hypothetical protein
MKRVTPFIPSSLETCAPPLEDAYVCTPANHVAHGRARPVCASNGGRACTRPSAGRALLPWSPLGHGRPYAHVRPFTVGPLGRARPTAVRTPRGVRAPLFAPHEAFALPVRTPRGICAPPFAPHETCTPMEAVRTLPRACLLSISSSKLLFILPLGHPGLQLP